MRCENCRWWAKRSEHGNCRTGECRRHAPMFTAALRSHWCVTGAADWCGEFQPTQEEE